MLASDRKIFTSPVDLSILQDLARLFKTRVHVLHVENEKEPLPAGYSQDPNAPGLEKILRGVKHTIGGSRRKMLLKELKRVQKSFQQI